MRNLETAQENLKEAQVSMLLSLVMCLVCISGVLCFLAYGTLCGGWIACVVWSLFLIQRMEIFFRKQIKRKEFEISELKSEIIDMTEEESESSK